MIQANDSVTHISNEAAEVTATHHYKTVEQVLRSLPDDATPAQQDSAVQANMPQREIHYSSRPDTLHLPGLEVKNNGESIVCNPHYPGESFFDMPSSSVPPKSSHATCSSSSTLSFIRSLSRK